MRADLVSLFSILSVGYMLYSGHYSEIGIVLILWAIHRHWVKVGLVNFQGGLPQVITQNAIAKKVGVTKEDLRAELRHQIGIAAFPHTVEMLKNCSELSDFKDDSP